MTKRQLKLAGCVLLAVIGVWIMWKSQQGWTVARLNTISSCQRTKAT